MFSRQQFLGLTLALSLPIAMNSLAGCGKLKEFTEEELAEAVANQMVSSYHAMSVELSVTGGNGNTVNLGIACEESGELTWAEYQEQGEICYTATSNGCTYSVGNREFSVTGTYEACGFPPSISTEGDAAQIEDLDGRTLYINGEVTVSSANFESSTCDYSLEISGITVSGSEGSHTVSSSISGDMCGRRQIDVDTSITVNNSFEVE